MHGRTKRWKRPVFLHWYMARSGCTDLNYTLRRSHSNNSSLRYGGRRKMLSKIHISRIFYSLMRAMKVCHSNRNDYVVIFSSHQVRTPLNHIIKCVKNFLPVRCILTLRFCSYLEMALNGPLDIETRENLSRSHIASKVNRSFV